MKKLFIFLLTGVISFSYFSYQTDDVDVILLDVSIKYTERNNQNFLDSLSFLNVVDTLVDISISEIVIDTVYVFEYKDLLGIIFEEFGDIYFISMPLEKNLANLIDTSQAQFLNKKWLELDKEVKRDRIIEKLIKNLVLVKTFEDRI